jgi:serine/threonine protein phosphatase PrpC
MSGNGEAPATRVGAESHTGRVRHENQDRLGRFRFALGDIFIVADGMGGHRGGATAATMVIEGMERHLKNVPPGARPDVALRTAALATNEEICSRSDSGDPTVAHMGSTIVFALINGRQMIIGHAGDSRAYLFRRGQLQQLTHDHTVVQKLVDRGILTPEEARNHPEASVLSRALGQHGDFELEVSDPVSLEPGDGVLLCSDGLCGYVEDASILGAITRYEDPQTVAHALIDLALTEGGEDNVTVQFIKVGEHDAATEAVLEPEATRPLAVESAAPPTSPAHAEPLQEPFPELAQALAPADDDMAPTQKIVPAPLTAPAPPPTQPAATPTPTPPALAAAPAAGPALAAIPLPAPVAVSAPSVQPTPTAVPVPVPAAQPATPLAATQPMPPTDAIAALAQPAVSTDKTTASAKPAPVATPPDDAESSAPTVPVMPAVTPRTIPTRKSSRFFALLALLLLVAVGATVVYFGWQRYLLGLFGRQQAAPSANEATTSDGLQQAPAPTEPAPAAAESPAPLTTDAAQEQSSDAPVPQTQPTEPATSKPPAAHPAASETSAVPTSPSGSGASSLAPGDVRRETRQSEALRSVAAPALQGAVSIAIIRAAAADIPALEERLRSAAPRASLEVVELPLDTTKHLGRGLILYQATVKDNAEALANALGYTREAIPAWLATQLPKRDLVIVPARSRAAE